MESRLQLKDHITVKSQGTMGRGAGQAEEEEMGGALCLQDCKLLNKSLKIIRSKEIDKK